MNSELIAVAVVDKLKSDIPVLESKRAPADIDNYKILHPNGALLVDIESMMATDPEGSRQAMLTTISVTACIRESFWNTQGMTILDDVRQALTNDLYIHGSRIWWTGTVRNGVEDRVWYWDLSFSLPGIMLQGE